MAEVFIEEVLGIYLTPEERADFTKTIDECIHVARSAVAKRLPEIARWSNSEQMRFKRWFGSLEPLAVSKITSGLVSMKSVLSQISSASFRAATVEEALKIGCTLDVGPQTNAAVCQISGPPKIMLGHEFFKHPVTGSWRGMDRGFVLIHELAHLPDVLGTRGLGEIYSFEQALWLAIRNPKEALNNSDNVAGYVMERTS